MHPSTALYGSLQEFVQSEIDREAATIANERERARKAEDRTAGVDDRLKRLREQVSTLQQGVSQVRDGKSAVSQVVELFAEHLCGGCCSFCENMVPGLRGW